MGGWGLVLEKRNFKNKRESSRFLKIFECRVKLRYYISVRTFGLLKVGRDRRKEGENGWGNGVGREKVGR